MVELKGKVRIDCKKVNIVYFISDACLDNVPPIEGYSLMIFLKEIKEAVSDAEILRLTEPFDARRIAKEILNLWLPLTDLYNKKYENRSQQDLLQFQVDVSISRNSAL